MIVNVKEIVEKEKQMLVKKVNDLKQKGIIPKLAVILANNEVASRVYVSKKKDMCAKLGIEEIEYILDENIKTDDILQIIEDLNEDKSVHGILVQLPLFNWLDTEKILSSIDPKKDVDGLNPINLGKLLADKDGLIPCTPKGIMLILDNLGVCVKGRHAVVVGKSMLVGRPMSQLLLNKSATVTVCHSKTVNLGKYTKDADILIVAVGKPNLITNDMVKPGSVVIDVGINKVDGKIVGDVDSENIKNIAIYLTPVPGGVGLTTVLSLLCNVIKVASEYGDKK